MAPADKALTAEAANSHARNVVLGLLQAFFVTLCNLGPREKVDAFTKEGVATAIPPLRPGAEFAALVHSHFGSVFFHLDEVSCISMGTGETDMRVFYHVWDQLLFPMIRRGHFVYCSGRSPMLYFVGRTRRVLKLQHLGLPPSPGDSICVMLPWLRPKYIGEMLAAQTLDRELRDTVFSWTGGVPRLVVHATDFLLKARNDGCTRVPTLTDFRRFLKNTRRGEAELYPHLPDVLKEPYMDVARLAALGVPLRPLQLEPTPELEIMAALQLYAGDVRRSDDGMQAAQLVRLAMLDVSVSHSLYYLCLYR